MGRVDRVHRISAWVVALSILLLWSPEPVQAQGPVQSLRGSLGTPFSYSVWTTDDGLPQNSVTAILRSRDGYLWLGTYGGLVRFDGVELVTFDLAHYPGLFSNRIMSLYEDRRGAIWLGLEGEGVARFQDGRFTSWGQDDGLPSGSVIAMSEDPAGALWLGGHWGLARLRDGIISTFDLEGGLSSTRIHDLLWDRRGQFWIGTSAGLVRWAGDGTPDVSAQFVTEEIGPAAKVYGLAEDAAGTLWLETDVGLVRYRDSRFEIVDGRPQHERHSRIMRLTSDGELWSSWFGGEGPIDLLRLEADASGPLERETLALPGGPPVLSILADHEDNIWLGTAGRGLFRLRRQPVQRLRRADGLPADEVRAVAPDGRGGLWMAFDCTESTLTHWDRSRVTHYDVDQEGRPLSCVSALLLARDGTLWLGAAGDLVRYRDGHFERFHLMDQEVEKEIINVIYEDRQGAFWVGLLDGGLGRFEDGAWQVFTSEDGLVNDDVRSLHEDRDGNLWIGTNAGLSRFRDGVFQSYKTDDGLPPGMVRALHEDDDGTLWIGTYGGGLGRLRDGDLVRVRVEDGLSEMVVSRILEDANDNLWMLGNQGMFFANRHELNAFADGAISEIVSVHLGRTEGMTEGSGGRQPAGWQTEDGKMWFPTIDGLAMVDAASYRHHGDGPPVTIQRLVTEEQSLTLQPKVRLETGIRNVEIHYTGLSLKAPEKLRFRYRLEGYDTHWIEAGGRRVAFYTGLPPGDYTFRVSARGPNGKWSASDASVQLLIPHFFYETWWFRLLCAAGLLALVYSIYRARLRAVQQRNARLQKEVEERRRAEAEREMFVEELERKNAELERFNYTVSHDLKTPLVTIKGFLGMLRQDVERGDRARIESDLDRISGAADKMNGLLDDLLELSRVGHQIDLQPVDLNAVVRETVDLMAGTLAKGDIQIDIADDLPTVQGDRVQLMEVFQNLLQNAARFMGPQTQPRISVVWKPGEEGMILCTVEDNGIGIEAEYQEKIFGLFERLDADTDGTGIGLALVKRIVELHGGRVWVESKGLERGSKFCLLLPWP